MQPVEVVGARVFRNGEWTHASCKGHSDVHSTAEEPGVGCLVQSINKEKNKKEEDAKTSQNPSLTCVLFVRVHDYSDPGDG
jgi:hypothetical protein